MARFEVALCDSAILPRMALQDERCKGCSGAEAKLTESEMESLLPELKHWAHSASSISRTIVFPDFPTVISAIRDIADLAEDLGHHPDFHVHYRKLRLECSTHSVGGLTRDDFVLAARINQLPCIKAIA